MYRALLFSLILCLASSATASQPLRLSVAPVKACHVAAEILKVAYDRLGIPVEFVRPPARRGLVEANEGSLDGETARIKGTDRELPNLIQVVPHLVVMEGVAYTTGRELTISGPLDLDGLIVGVHTGILFAEELVNNMAHVQKRTWDQLFDMLYADRLDVVIADRGSGDQQRGRPGAERLHACEPPIAEYPLYHYLHVRHVHLAARVSRELGKMLASGELARIREEAEKKDYDIDL